MKTKEEYLKDLEARLTKDDWQFIQYAVQERFAEAESRKNEPPPSRAFVDQKARVMAYLNRRAY